LLATLALSLAAVVGGALATYLYDRDSPPLARIFTGACTGYAAFALAGFLVAWLTERSSTSLVLPVVTATVVVLLPLLLLRRSSIRSALSGDLRAVEGAVRGFAREPSLASIAQLAYWGVIALGLWLVFDQVVFERADGLYTGFVNNLGDLPFHIQASASFAFDGNVPPEDPTYLGTTFSYPYMADFLSAMFMSAGASIRDALLVPNLVLGASLVGVLHRWTRDLTGDRLAAMLAPLLLLLSGGLGWLTLLQDAQRGGNGILGALTSLSHDYSIGGDSIYRFGNAITTLLVPQRSFLFGLPIAIVVFTLLWAELRDDPDRSPEATPPAGRDRGSWGAVQMVAGTIRADGRMLAAGLLTGTLVLVHAYTFVSVMATAFLFGLIFRQWRDGLWRGWVVFVVAAAVIALPELAWSTIGSHASAGSFIGVEIGWDRGEHDPVTFWLANTGLLIPLLVLAYLWSGPGKPLVSRRLRLYYLPFLAWFIVPNVLRLAPWIWDNIKVLFIWYTASVPIVAVVLATALRDRGAVRTVGVLVLLSLTLAGGLDVFRAVSGQTQNREYDRDGMALASQILQATPTGSVVLHAPTYNPPPYLTGRRSVMGYPGQIWSKGLEYLGRQQDIEHIYAGGADAAGLIRQYGVDYIEVSPIERGMMTVNDAFFAHFKVVAQAGEYRLYAVKP
jgi:hypothetical protein